MMNLDWSIVSSVSKEGGVVLEGVSFIGRNTGVKVLRPCSKNILVPIFTDFNCFYQLIPIHRAGVGPMNHLSTVELFHANITSAESRSVKKSMPPVGDWLHISPTVADDILINRSKYHSQIVNFMNVYIKKLRAEQHNKFG
jgi:hypothetical protein